MLLGGVFCMVGSQMAWTLRPYLVRPRTVSAPFVRGVEGTAAPVTVDVVQLGEVGLDLASRLIPMLVVMAVAIGASCAFLTPIGHQCNTLVMGPGGYHFGDYWRLGLPMEILVVAVSLPVLLLVWPL